MWIFSSFQVPYNCSSSPGLRFAARCLHSPRSRRHRCCCSHWTRFFSSWRLSLLFCRRHLRSFCELSEKSALHWTPVTAWTLDTAAAADWGLLPIFSPPAPPSQLLWPACRCGRPHLNHGSVSRGRQQQRGYLLHQHHFLWTLVWGSSEILL